MSAALEVRDPAAAAAIGRCLAARFRDPVQRIAEAHPTACGWCIYPGPELEAMLAGFNAWADVDEKTGRYHRFEVRRFVEQPSSVQRLQVAAAQALEDEPWRAEPAPVPLAAEPSAITTTKRPAWAGGGSS